MMWTTGDGYQVSDERERLDLGVIHGFLSASYWSPGIPRALVEKSIAHSLCFGIFAPDHAQVGFARVVTDQTSFAYLADVFVLEAHRGRGLSRFLMTCITGHPELQNLRRWLLATRDAHGLYAKFGFTPLSKPDRMMERTEPEVYQRLAR